MQVPSENKILKKNIHLNNFQDTDDEPLTMASNYKNMHSGNNKTKNFLFNVFYLLKETMKNLIF